MVSAPTVSLPKTRWQRQGAASGGRHPLIRPAACVAFWLFVFSQARPLFGLLNGLDWKLVLKTFPFLAAVG